MISGKRVLSSGRRKSHVSNSTCTAAMFGLRSSPASGPTIPIAMTTSWPKSGEMVVPGRIASLGWPIVEEEYVSGADRVLAPDAGARTGAIIYRRVHSGTLIDGPWQVAQIGGADRLCLQPKEDSQVVEHELRRLSPETYHIWKDRHDEDRAVLLVEPEKEMGRIIDLMPDSGLAEWLVRVLKRDRGDKVGKTLLPKVGELLAAATDQLQRLPVCPSGEGAEGLSRG